ncbi:hypothetical protein MASR1M60_29970 [Rhodocyclaceae bacterium]
MGAHRLLQYLNPFAVIVRRTVREIQSHDIDSGRNELIHGFGI